jgi:hypothetical protein
MTQTVIDADFDVEDLLESMTTVCRRGDPSQITGFEFRFLCTCTSTSVLYCWQVR